MAEGWVDENPVPAFREMLREASKTKAGRAETESKANPIERPEDVAALVEASRSIAIDRARVGVDYEAR